MKKLLAAALAAFLVLTPIAHAGAEPLMCIGKPFDTVMQIYEADVTRDERRVSLLNKEITYAVIKKLAVLQGFKPEVLNDSIAKGAILFFPSKDSFVFLTLDKSDKVCGWAALHILYFNTHLKDIVGEDL